MLSSEEPAPLISPDERRLRRIEWLCLYFLPFGNSMIVSLTYLFSGFHSASSTTRTALAPERFLIAAALQAATLLLLSCILKRRGQSLSTVGWRLPLSWRDGRDAILLATAFWLVYTCSSYLFTLAVWALPALRVLSPHDVEQNTRFLTTAPPQTTGFALILLWFARSVNLLTNPLCEEVIARAFTQSELETVQKYTPRVAAVLSALLQAAYHLYQGPVAAFSLFVGFLCLSLYFSWKQRLVPIVGAHLFLDAMAFLHFGTGR